MTTVTNSVVELEDVAVRFGTVEIFAGVSFEIRSGERFALLGPSGCGKSTLLRLVAGLEPPTEGRLRIHGREASAPGAVLLEPQHRSLAMVFQDLALWPNLTVLANVELGLAGAGLPRHERRARASAALEACRIAELGGRRPDALSGGQQQRVALARALAVQPNLLLLDEPFSSLDIATKSHLYRAIRRLCDELGLTLVVVSHDPMEAAALCSRAAVLEGGRIVELGAFQSLLRAPASETLRLFVTQLSRATGEPGAVDAAASSADFPT